MSFSPKFQLQIFGAGFISTLHALIEHITIELSINLIRLPIVHIFILLIVAVSSSKMLNYA
jgi:hypothetical protein